MLISIINFIGGAWWLWLTVAPTTFVLMTICGTRWETSGKTEKDRKAFLMVLAKIFAATCGTSTVLFVISMMVDVLRAIARG
jgi:hypothetical protein